MNDEEAFTAFYQRTSAPLWRYLRRIAGNEAVADDLLQESYVRFLGAPAGERAWEGRSQSAYLYRIATNLVRDRWRRQKREESWLQRLFSGASEVAETRADLRLDFEAVFERLKYQERALLWLAYVEGYDHQEIAEVLGLGAGSIRVLLFRARKKLAGLLGKEPKHASPGL